MHGQKTIKFDEYIKSYVSISDLEFSRLWLQGLPLCGVLGVSVWQTNTSAAAERIVWDTGYVLHGPGLESLYRQKIFFSSQKRPDPFRAYSKSTGVLSCGSKTAGA
jgi:hypothetical protein